MKLSVDPMPALLADAEMRVIDHFNRLAYENLHADHLHHVVAATGQADKPHPILSREQDRAALLTSVRNSKSPADLAALMSAAGL